MRKPIRSTLIVALACSVHLTTAGPALPAPPQPVCGDVNETYTVTSADALSVLKKAVEQPVTLVCPPIATVSVHGASLEYPEATSSAPNVLWAVPITLSEDAYVIHIGVFGKTAGAQAKLALYDDDGGTPGALLNGTGTFTMSVGKREVPVNFPIFLPAGTYWVASIFDSSSSIGFKTEPGESRYRSWTFGDSLPDPFGPASTADSEKYNFYLKTIP